MIKVPSWPRSLGPSGWQFVADVVVVLAVWIGVLVFSGITVEVKRSDTQSLVMALVATIVTLAVMKRRGLYAGRPALPRTDEISRVFVSMIAGSSSIAVFAAFLDWYIGAREILIGGVLIFGLRILVKGFTRELATEIQAGERPERVVIVGTGAEARDLADLIVDHPETRFHLAGVVGNLSVAERSGLIDCWLGPTSRLIELMRHHDVVGAIVTANGFRSEQFRTITRDLFHSGYDVHLTTGVSRLGQGRFALRSMAHEPLVVMERNRVRPSHLAAKRLLDIVGASLLLLLASPVMAATALLIWIEDRGPITYTSVRAGRRGSFFPMYKFRSMVTNADELKKQMEADNERTGPLFKMSNDPRITRIGKFIRETSIDELPQLINVVKGHMSLVGPRPALPEEEAEFDEELRDRFEVRPGITGLWQVEARSNASFNAYRRLDLHYVENWTLSLDLRILLATAEQVAVALALVPLRLVRRRAGSDGVSTTSTTKVTRTAGHDGAGLELDRTETAVPAVTKAVPAANGVAAAPQRPPAEPFQGVAVTAEHTAVPPLYSQLQATNGHRTGDAQPRPTVTRRPRIARRDQPSEHAPTANGHPANGQPTNGHGPNGRPANGHPANGQPTNGHGANGRPANGHAAANGKPANGHAANGRPANGHAAANGKPANGHAANGDPANSNPAIGHDGDGGDAVTAPTPVIRPDDDNVIEFADNELIDLRTGAPLRGSHDGR